MLLNEPGKFCHVLLSSFNPHSMLRNRIHNYEDGSQLGPQREAHERGEVRSKGRPELVLLREILNEGHAEGLLTFT